MQNLKSRLILSIVFALVVFVALTFYADAPRLLSALAKFDWRFLPFALVTTVVNYLLRFVRWHYYLDVIGVKNVPRRDSLLIFLSGFSLTVTPGKLGEVLKSVLLRTRYGTPVSYSASIVFAERLTDVLGVVILAAAGLVFYPVGIGALIAVLVITFLFVVVVQQRALAETILDRIARTPKVGRFADLARNLYESAYLMLRAKPLVIAIGLATAAWFGECLTFFIVLLGIGLAPTLLLLLQATFIYAAASLFGAVSMLPGGLGATEGGMALLLQQIVGVAREEAVASTLIVRLCTLWLAVLLGGLALLIFGRLKGKTDLGASITGEKIRSTDNPPNA
ncbi:MAG TPA: lysylphosphatidylglycerol synthase transmembrane domain-containing protein [Anaerolineae bacterium]